MTALRKRGEKVCLVPQNLIEFWSVATRPTSANGLGLSVEKTTLEIRKFKRYFHFLDDKPNIFFQWESLVTKYRVLGENAHDARLVAAMIEHDITDLLTFNGKDFKRFDEIVTVDPRNITWHSKI